MDPSSRRGDADRHEAPFYLPPLPSETMIRGDRRRRGGERRSRRERSQRRSNSGPLYGLRAWGQILMGVLTYGITFSVFVITTQASDLFRHQATGWALSMLGLFIFCFYALFIWRWRWHWIGVMLGFSLNCLYPAWMFVID
jgi:hypothetical protein